MAVNDKAEWRMDGYHITDKYARGLSVVFINGRRYQLDENSEPQQHPGMVEIKDELAEEYRRISEAWNKHVAASGIAKSEQRFRTFCAGFEAGYSSAIDDSAAAINRVMKRLEQKTV